MPVLDALGTCLTLFQQWEKNYNEMQFVYKLTNLCWMLSFFPWTTMNTYNACFDFHMHLKSYTFFFLFKYSPDALSRGFCFTFTFCGDWMWSTDTFHCFCDECATILVPLKNRKEEHFSLMSVWQLCLAQFVGFGQHYQQKQTLIQRKSPLK